MTPITVAMISTAILAGHTSLREYLICSPMETSARPYSLIFLFCSFAFGKFTIRPMANALHYPLLFLFYLICCIRQNQSNEYSFTSSLYYRELFSALQI